MCVREESCRLFALEGKPFKLTLVRFLRRIKHCYCLRKRDDLIEPVHQLSCWKPHVVMAHGMPEVCVIPPSAPQQVQLLVLTVNSAFVISSEVTLFAINQTVEKKVLLGCFVTKIDIACKARMLAMNCSSSSVEAGKPGSERCYLTLTMSLK